MKQSSNSTEPQRVLNARRATDKFVTAFKPQRTPNTLLTSSSVYTMVNRDCKQHQDSKMASYVIKMYSRKKQAASPRILV